MFDRFYIFSPLRNIFLSVTAAPLSWLYEQRIEWDSTHRDRGELSSEIQNLEQQLSDVLSENVRFKLSVKDARLYEKTENFLKSQGWTGVKARILSRSGSRILLNQGEKDGVEVDRPVIAGEGLLVAKISEVYRDYSYAHLLTDSQSRVAAEVQTDASPTGLVLGSHDLGLVLQYAPKSSYFQNGDQVITSGLEEKIPRGLLIGEVFDLRISSDDLFLESSVTPPITYQRLFLVNILTPSL